MLDRSLKILELILVAAVVFFCVEIFYETVESRLQTASMTGIHRGAVDTGTDGGGSGQKSRAGKQFSDYEVIVARNLFNTRQEEKTPEDIKSSDLEDLEKTKLELRLLGTISGADGSSYAVIENESDSEQQLYRTGDTIEEARLKMILRKKVVLDVDGKDEILEMDEEGKRHGSKGDSGQDDTESGEDGSEDTIDIGRDRISEALQDVNNLMRQVRVRPYFEDGESRGVMLSGIRGGSIFEEMGLESGDVIQAVNGEEIRSMDDAMGFYKDLESAGEVRVEIKRDGTRQSINYRID
ncbi:MAG: type II secretion system protein GspC [Desulfobacterales bacterium]